LSDTLRQGRQWEKVAESFLKKHGLKTLKRNFLARSGEIDLIMLDGKTVVFAEVRYRENDRHGSGADSVTWKKQQRIIKAARLFLQYHGRHRRRPCRFDVVSIGNENGRPVLNWIQDAFDAG
jgi:putative endonuclease